ncbi:40S small subunit ribosomal protein uS13 (rpS18) [Andalucia godoyi]|uniref:40S small subunit ribosomal protein uS13 (RpS18) n=1 Tax=Andalucia godoyi TaxID=505711 RepID=A0A8K0AGZ6_ANDGO|nr:40S small subunit ribosomal protein uS13 (rpS18) [Andalucia godoyi]|eukprot:ANDGO_00747.mRNA.1 40S small subunit ribosomal protein uS13 (rpS18)
MSLSLPEGQFIHIRRILNTNIDGKAKVMYALTKIRGIGRRFSNLVCKRAKVDMAKRAGELSNEEIERLVAVIQNPLDFNIPDWFVNRRRDMKDGATYQVTSNNVDTVLRDDLERLKKIRCHRGLRHSWNIKVRGQRTGTTGRRGRPALLQEHK